jgi:hypothetical protein
MKKIGDSDDDFREFQGYNWSKKKLLKVMEMRLINKIF